MGLTERIVIAVLLVVGAVLFVFALKAEPEAKPVSPAEETQQTVAAGIDPTPTAPEAKPGVLDSDENCKECHEEIWNEWQTDRHSKAWVGVLFTELSNNHQDSSCWSCHAPRPVLETGTNSPAETRANRRELGITCLTCHKRGNHVVGSYPNPKATPAVEPDCGPVFDPKYPSATNQEGTNEFCGVCHNLHGTCDEFSGSRYAREGKTCLSCHMEEALSPVAKGGEPRVRLVHRMPGAHSPEMLRQAMTLDPRLEDGELVVRVVNRGAGHRIPTDARHRAIRLFAEFFDAYGQPVAVQGPNGRVQRSIEMDLIRLFYRHEQKEPTQVDPDGTLGKNNWRESRASIPAAAAGGHARLRLYYFLRHDWPPHKGVMVEERKVELGG